MKRIGVIKEYIEYYNVPKSSSYEEITDMVRNNTGLQILNKIQIFKDSEISNINVKEYLEEDYNNEILSLDNKIN